MKDEKAIDWREGFPNFQWIRKGLGGIPRKKNNILCLGKEKEDNEIVKKNLILMCGKGVVHEKDVCKQELN
jgi:hypothetical protein